MTTHPTEPEVGHGVWYRGWECDYDVEAALWMGEGWRAYKGGPDIDAPNCSARTWAGLLSEIDDAEDSSSTTAIIAAMKGQSNV